jgi:hypothetical protein
VGAFVSAYPWNSNQLARRSILVRKPGAGYCSVMAVVMRLVSLILIVAALVFLGADAVSSLERGGELTVRSLDSIWGMVNATSLLGFKSWVQNNLAFMAQGVYSSLAMPAWAITGVVGVILAFVFGRRHGPE